MKSTKSIRGAAIAASIMATALGVSVLTGVGTASASAVVVVIPSNCGPYSNQLAPANTTVLDFSGGPAVGTSAVPYQIVPGANTVLLVGSSYNDYIQGSAFADIICGRGGEDEVGGGGGDDEIYGGPGNDVLYGEENGDSIAGGYGDDVIWGDAPTPTGVDTNDDLYGGEGSDEIHGGPAADIIHGGNGPVGNNNDTAYGDAGVDTCFDVENVFC